MNANSKWISVESLGEPVTRVARRAIKARLRWLWSRLPVAVKHGGNDPESVHQLRVATRRAQAAMETFAPYLPPRRAAWFDRQAKRIRHAAGEARDLDVLADRLKNELAENRSAAATALFERIATARRQSQPEIAAVYHRLLTRKFDQRIDKLVRRVRFRHARAKDPCGGDSCECGAADGEGQESVMSPGACGCGRKPSIAEAARARMRQLVDEWFYAAEADLSDTHRLHLFRIAGKRLRYAMEIFASALGSNCRKTLYPLIADLLERLGQINDHVSSEARLQIWLSETEQPEERAILSRLLSSDADAITAGLHDFFQLWTVERRESLRAQFRDELAD